MIERRYKTLGDLGDAIEHAEALWLRWMALVDCDGTGEFILRIYANGDRTEVTP